MSQNMPHVYSVIRRGDVLGPRCIFSVGHRATVVQSMTAEYEANAEQVKLQKRDQVEAREKTQQKRGRTQRFSFRILRLRQDPHRR